MPLPALVHEQVLEELPSTSKGTEATAVVADLFASQQLLAIQHQSRTVYSFNGYILSRKLVYDKPIVSAFYTALNKDECLAVVLQDCCYIYYKDGSNHNIFFPFNISNAVPYENGIVIEKADSINGALVTVTDPIAEFGTITSSTTTSISVNENLLFFPTSSNNSITVNYNESENKLIFYNTRFLSRNNVSGVTGAIAAPITPGTKRKPSIRKTSIINETNEDSADSIINIEKKRNMSHSDAMSVDRMSSYEFSSASAATNNNINNNNIPITQGTPNPGQSTRKDAILTKIDSISLKIQSSFKKFKMKSISFENKEAIIIKNDEINLFEVIIFQNNNNDLNFSSTSKIIDSINLSNFNDFETIKNNDYLKGYLILLVNNKIILFNPFLNLYSSEFATDLDIKNLQSCYDDQLIVNTKDDDFFIINLSLQPSNELVLKCLNNLKYLTNSFTLNYVWIIWLNSFNLLDNDWDAFVLTLLSILFPINSNLNIKVENDISKLIKFLPEIQQSLIPEFNLFELSPNFFLSLHILREDLKLNILNSKDVERLGLLLSQLSAWFNWSNVWKTYYNIDEDLIDTSLNFNIPQIIENPPNLMKSLASLFDPTIVPYLTFHRLAQEPEQLNELITPRTHYILKLFEALISTNNFTLFDVVNIMSEYNITLEKLETYPIGIIIPLQEAISYCQHHISLDLNDSIDQFKLIDRKDLQMLINSTFELKSSSSLTKNMKIHQNKDVNQIINSINNNNTESIESNNIEITRLIFSKDRSFYEISKILQSFKIQSVFFSHQSSIPETEYLLQRKNLANLVCLRTLSIPIGRAAVFYQSKNPLITEHFPIPKLNFNTLFEPSNTTVTLDKEELNKELFQWGFFHNGVSAALTISQKAKGINGSWVVFNKPNELNSQHGGFLLGLGLNGFLKNLEEWNIYNYLGPKHTFTSVGLLLGMSASLRGTMDVKLTKVLSVHVVALLPQGASDLIVSVPVQTAGLIGIGLLYLETSHRRMSEILLSQIVGNVLVEEKSISNESYRLSAGFSLGFINLGKGDGLSDTHLIDQLLSISTTIKDVQDFQNIDKSMSGSIIALTLLFLKTNNKLIAKKIELPKIEKLFDYIRPDILLLRVLSKNLIMWDFIENNMSWINEQMPFHLRSLTETKLERSGDLMEGLNYYYILSGICLSIGIKFASTGDLSCKRNLLIFFDKINKELISFNNDFDDYSNKIIIHTLILSRNLILLSLSLIMSSTGDLDIFRRLRIIHQKEFNLVTNKNGHGKFMIINMSLGFLFLGGGQYCFNTRDNFSIASLLISIYPIFPITDKPEDDVHLQALRHFWALSVENRCLIVRDVETSKPIETEVEVEIVSQKKSLRLKTPCLLPSFEKIRKIVTTNEDYFKVEMNKEIINEYLIKKRNLNLFIYKKDKFESFKKNLNFLIEKINGKFLEENKSNDGLINLELFKNFNKFELKEILNEEINNNNNLIDKQLELNQLINSPKTIDDLWNLKIIISFYDKILTKSYFLKIQFVDELKIKLFKKFQL